MGRGKVFSAYEVTHNSSSHWCASGQVGGIGAEHASVVLLQYEYTFLPLIVWPLTNCWSFLSWSENEERPGKNFCKNQMSTSTLPHGGSAQ